MLCTWANKKIFKKNKLINEIYIFERQNRGSHLVHKYSSSFFFFFPFPFIQTIWINLILLLRTNRVLRPEFSLLGFPLTKNPSYVSRTWACMVLMDTLCTAYAAGPLKSSSFVIICCVNSLITSWWSKAQAKVEMWRLLLNTTHNHSILYLHCHAVSPLMS